MPRYDDAFLDFSVYLYPTAESADKGVKVGGTGFLVNVLASDLGEWLLPDVEPVPHRHHSYVVTNRHNLDNLERPEHLPKSVVRLNTEDGKTSIIPAKPEDWYLSDNHDLAVLPIRYRDGDKFLSINARTFLTREIATQQDVGIGDEVFMIGRFINHEGNQRNSPTIRFGHVSMMPSEDDPVVHRNSPTGKQVSFLVEVHTVPGYSGSPVLVRPFPTEKLPATTHRTRYTQSFEARPYLQMVTTLLMGGPWLLGVQWGILNLPDPRDDKRSLYSGLSGVVPAWYLRDLLDSPPVRAQHAEEQRRFVEETRNSGEELTASE
jgi:hypothetical protein